MTCSISLNTIYLTLFTQKAQRTYRCILEGEDSGDLWSYVVEKTGEPGETTNLGRATTTLPHADTGIRAWVTAVASECFNQCAIQALIVALGPMAHHSLFK